MDIIVYTPEELKLGMQGVVILGRKLLKPESFYMKEYEKWFKKAEEDLFVVKHILALKDALGYYLLFSHSSGW